VKIVETWRMKDKLKIWDLKAEKEIKKK